CTLVVDTVIPTVTSLVASGTGITGGAGTLFFCAVLPLTGTILFPYTTLFRSPTLVLNDGGVATYSGGSGTSALTFSYTVAAGQNTADLAVTTYATNPASVASASSGTNADLSGAVANPAGALVVDTVVPTVNSL